MLIWRPRETFNQEYAMKLDNLRFWMGTQLGKKLVPLVWSKTTFDSHILYMKARSMNGWGDLWSGLLQATKNVRIYAPFLYRAWENSSPLIKAMCFLMTLDHVYGATCTVDWIRDGSKWWYKLWLFASSLYQTISWTVPLQSSLTLHTQPMLDEKQVIGCKKPWRYPLCTILRKYGGACLQVW